MVLYLGRFFRFLFFFFFLKHSSNILMTFQQVSYQSGFIFYTTWAQSHSKCSHSNYFDCFYRVKFYTGKQNSEQVTFLISRFDDLYLLKLDLFFIRCFCCCFLSLDQMQTLCKNHFFPMVYRKTDGTILWSQNERNLDCALTFQTHSILQRFLVRFDTLQLDCNDHLFIYDGAHATGTPKVNTFFRFIPFCSISLSFSLLIDREKCFWCVCFLFSTDGHILSQY